MRGIFVKEQENKMALVTTVKPGQDGSAKCHRMTPGPTRHGVTQDIDMFTAATKKIEKDG